MQKNKSPHQNEHNFLFIFNENIVSGLDHSLGENQILPSDFVVDMFLTQFSQPPKKV